MSKQFSHLERFFANRLSKFPILKQTAKKTYQYLNYFLYRTSYKYKSDYTLTEYGKVGKDSFFGYYDHSPENSTREYIIYQESSFRTNELPTPSKAIKIILFDIKVGKEIFLFPSTAYNWQQGTKLQWISDYRFIFNYCNENNQYGSIIINAQTKQIEKRLSFPIYDVHSNYALSLNFDRLAKYRPDYGYRNHEKTHEYLLPYHKDGIFYIDLKNNTQKLLISLKKLIDISPLPSMKNAKHKVNHIMISPDGDKFIFLHRWLIKGGKRFDRLLVSDKNGKNIRILADNGMVSHYCWGGNDTIIGFLRNNSYGDSFYKIDVNTQNIQLLSEKLLSLGDGHPSVCNDLMVFDSYPDRSRMKKLYLFNLKDESLETIGEFLEPLKYFGETRCDLHPKWNYKGNKIFIDSVHEGKRKLYEIKL